MGFQNSQLYLLVVKRKCKVIRLKLSNWLYIKVFASYAKKKYIKEARTGNRKILSLTVFEIFRKMYVGSSEIICEELLLYFLIYNRLVHTLLYTIVSGLRSWQTSFASSLLLSFYTRQYWYFWPILFSGHVQFGQKCTRSIFPRICFHMAMHCRLCYEKRPIVV